MPNIYRGGKRDESGEHKAWQAMSGLSLRLSGIDPLVTRRSSRSAGRAAAAPYPTGKRSSSSGEGFTGLTPCLSLCAVNQAGFDEEGDALVQLVMSPRCGLPQAIIRRSSTLGQLESVSEAVRVSTGRHTAAAAVPARDQGGRAHSLPVRKGKISWRSDVPINLLGGLTPSSSFVPQGWGHGGDARAGSSADGETSGGDKAMARQLASIADNLSGLKQVLSGTPRGTPRRGSSGGSGGCSSGGSGGGGSGGSGGGGSGGGGGTPRLSTASSARGSLRGSTRGSARSLTSARRSSDAGRLIELAQAAQMTPLLAVLHEIIITEHHYVEDLRLQPQPQP